MSAPLFAAGEVTWLVGIEDTCVYPSADGPTGRMGNLDEHVLTDHHEHWRADLTEASALGATAIRYGMSWPLVHLAPGKFDWTTLDGVVDHTVDVLGLDLVADLVHYGTPAWLPLSFADPDFPAALAEFAEALAHRYRGRIRAYTPVNEPVTTASFCGLRAVWPPYRTGWTGWVDVVVPMITGAALATHAIRRADPEALIVHVEASTAVTAGAPEHDAEAAHLTAVGWLPTDLLLGRVGADHPMRDWLLDHGAPPDALAALAAAPGSVDVMGVNYYPDLTPRTLQRVGDRVLQIAHDGGTAQLETALRRFALRYGLPLAVTETSIEGEDDVRVAWAQDAARTVLALAGELDIRGFTWWPLLDFVDWSWAAGGANVEEFAVAYTDERGQRRMSFAPPLGTPDQGRTPFLRRMGLVRLEELADGSLARHRTAAAEAFSRCTSLQQVQL